MLCGNQRAPPDTPGPAAAFRELLRGRHIYEDGADAGLNVARYTTPENVSLPTTLEGSPYLDEVAPQEVD